MPTTSPDNIYFSDTTTTMDPNAISAAQATSAQAALALRQRYEFVWANAAARTAQTGMVTGSTGYQVDTKTEYIYESATWRLKTPHAELTASASVPSGGVQGIGTPSVDATASTDVTMVTGIVNGIQIARPGIYAITLSGTWTVVATGDMRLDIATDPPPAATGVIVRSRILGGSVDFVSNTLPNLRVTSSNFNLYFPVVQSTAGAKTLNSRIYVTRLG